MKDDGQFSNLDAVVGAMRAAAVHLVPPPDMLPSEWAENNVVIPVGNAIPGPINFDNAPYQRGMVNVIKEPGVLRADFMTGAQIGKTLTMQCAVGFFIAHEPRSQIFAQPSQGDMQTFMETKMKPMIEANPAISMLMAKPRSRHGVNNSRIVSYVGGWLMTAWAGSPKTARGRSAPVIHADEVDGMPPTAEGDFVELLGQRAATFGDQRLMLRSSTPTIKGASRIETGFQEGDQRRFYVPCPDCGEGQYLKWSSVHWTGRKSTDIADADEDIGQEHQPETAMYSCEACGVLWDDGRRIGAIRNAERDGHGWKAAKPFKGHASFHAPEMLSTFRRLRDIVQSYLDKLAVGDLQSFVNVSLAETWEERGDKADPNTLMARREVYRAQVPMGGVWLSAGIDAQQDRLEVKVKAWGVGEESWRIAYYVLWGDPLAPEVWQELEDVLNEEFEHESGAMLRIGGACLDTGGTNSYTQVAYDWLRGKTGRRIFGVKGVAGWGRPIVEKPQRKQSGKNARKVDLFLVGVDEAKLIIMRRLNMPSPGPGYIHFSQDADAEYFQQLTAEKLVTRYVKGYPKREWTKPDRARNEALDTEVYSFAALKIMQPNLKRLAEKLQQFAQQNRGIIARKTEETPKKIGEQQKIAANDNKPTQNPQEERPAPRTENSGIVRSKRALKARNQKGNWATKW
jgi:phage terminase large subunit GpA-like protein